MRYKQISENYSPEQDKQNAKQSGDTRKARLTLVHLGKLRKMREYRKYQDEIRAKLLKRMYGGQPSGEEGGMPPMDQGMDFGA
jgi:hypothetical protein